MPTTMTTCCQSSCCRPSIALPSGDIKQDSTLAHCAAHAAPHFTAPDLWPLNSPDLNPADYEVWCVAGTRVPHASIWSRWPEAAPDCTWSGLEQRVINEAIDHWHGRLRLCVRADGQHFEHLLWAKDLFFFVSWPPSDFTVWLCADFAFGTHSTCRLVYRVQ